jgi:hypothetical protein
MGAPLQFVEAALQAHDQGFRLIAHWLNSQPPLQRSKVIIEPCSPPPGASLDGCRNVLSNALLGIRPYVPEIPKDDRNIAPWSLGCLSQSKSHHSYVRLYNGDDDETVEERIERLVAIYDAYGWSAEDWRVCVKAAVEQHAEQWRNALKASAEPAPAGGPVGVDMFLWGGQTYRGLTNKSFALVSTLWAAKHRTLSKAEVEEAVYGDELAPENGLASLRRQVNAFFLRHRIPLQVTIRSGKVALLNGASKPRAKKPAKRS